MMVYFRVLPLPLSEIDGDFSDFFFKFANTYTEESVLRGYQKEEFEKEKSVTADDLRDLGYSDEDILNMES